MNDQGKILIYQAEDGDTSVEVESSNNDSANNSWFNTHILQLNQETQETFGSLIKLVSDSIKSLFSFLETNILPKK